MTDFPLRGQSSLFVNDTKRCGVSCRVDGMTDFPLRGQSSLFVNDTKR